MVLLIVLQQRCWQWRRLLLLLLLLTLRLRRSLLELLLVLLLLLLLLYLLSLLFLLFELLLFLLLWLLQLLSLLLCLLLLLLQPFLLKCGVRCCLLGCAWTTSGCTLDDVLPHVFDFFLLHWFDEVLLSAAADCLQDSGLLVIGRHHCRERGPEKSVGSCTGMMLGQVVFFLFHIRPTLSMAVLTDQDRQL